MNEDTPLKYDVWIEDALRDVIKRALKFVEDFGLPDDHHFYLTFCTQDEGVSIPSSIKNKYPEEMTIVIQHQYRDFAVSTTHLSLTLYFEGNPEHLIIPFTSIVSFSDPAVNFGLQLSPSPTMAPRALKQNDTELTDSGLENKTARRTYLKLSENNESDVCEDIESNTSKIIPLDTFRKK